MNIFLYTHTRHRRNKEKEKNTHIWWNKLQSGEKKIIKKRMQRICNQKGSKKRQKKKIGRRNEWTTWLGRKTMTKMKQKTNGRNLLSSAIWCDVIFAQQNGTKTSWQLNEKAIANGYSIAQHSTSHHSTVEEHLHSWPNGMHSGYVYMLSVLRQKTPGIVFYFGRLLAWYFT